MRNKSTFDRLDAKKESLTKRVCELYDRILIENSNILEGLKKVRERVGYLRDVNLAQDVDVVRVVHFLDEILDRVDGINLAFNDDHDLRESHFVGEPLACLERALARFEFNPVAKVDVRMVREFFSNSKVLK